MNLNGENKLEEILVQKATIQKIPLSSTFELTPYCNLNCNMCYIRMGKKEINEKGGILGKEKWMEYAEELKSLGCLFILLTGGEPILHPDFIYIYKELKKKGFIITINTNGTVINSEIINTFKEYPPRRVNVTLYGSSNETYKKLCHSSKGYDKTIKAIKSLKDNEIATKLNATFVKDNIEDFNNILDISNQLEIPLEITSYLFPAMRSCKVDADILESRLKPEEAARLEWDIKINEKKVTKDFFYSFAKDQFIKNPQIGEKITLTCRAAKSSCWINWQGKMTPCVFMETPSVDLSSTSVSKAWEIIKEEAQNLHPYEQCEGCKIQKYCNVCYAAALHENNSRGNLDYLCNMSKAKLKLLDIDYNTL